MPRQQRVTSWHKQQRHKLLHESMQAHVTLLLVNWQLFATGALLIVAYVHHSCHNGLEIELQCLLQIVDS